MSTYCRLNFTNTSCWCLLHQGKIECSSTDCLLQGRLNRQKRLPRRMQKRSLNLRSPLLFPEVPETYRAVPEAPIAPASSSVLSGRISRHQLPARLTSSKSCLLLRRPLTKYFQCKKSGDVVKNKLIFSFVLFIHTPQH